MTGWHKYWDWKRPPWPKFVMEYDDDEVFYKKCIYKAKAVTPHATKALGGRGDIAPHSQPRH
jgi:hypothetical protein